MLAAISLDLKVDVKNPDINLRIEIRQEAVYLSCETIQGQADFQLVQAERQCSCFQEGLTALLPDTMQ